MNKSHLHCIYAIVGSLTSCETKSSTIAQANLSPVQPQSHDVPQIIECWVKGICPHPDHYFLACLFVSVCVGCVCVCLCVIHACMHATVYVEVNGQLEEDSSFPLPFGYQGWN